MIKAMILLHGRGAGSENIMELSRYFGKLKFSAPEAPGRQWYPRSFLAPVEENQPYLDKSLRTVSEEIKKLRLKNEEIIILGFSQGACLSLEYAARNPERYGGIIALSGGLITLKHNGNMKGTPVFLGCSDIDPFIPLKRINESTDVFEKLGAKVTKKIYEGFEHSVNEDEIRFVQELVKRR